MSIKPDDADGGGGGGGGEGVARRERGKGQGGGSVARQQLRVVRLPVQRAQRSRKAQEDGHVQKTGGTGHRLMGCFNGERRLKRAKLETWGALPPALSRERELLQLKGG